MAHRINFASKRSRIFTAFVWLVSKMAYGTRTREYYRPAF